VTRTFLDAGVLIAAIRGMPEIADCAVERPGKPLFRMEGWIVYTLLDQ
jgi:hypothetical protein